MDIAFALRAIWALALVAAVLLVMLWVARSIQRTRIAGLGTFGARLVATIESTALAQNVTVHVIRVAGKYYLVGGGSAGVNLLSELAADEIEPYVEAHRAAAEAQRALLMRPFARFGKS